MVPLTRHAHLVRSLTGTFLAFRLTAVASAQTSPVGWWNTISDTDGKPTAVVEIRQIGNELSGVVRELLVVVLRFALRP